MVKDFGVEKALIVVPHQDDEVNLVGNILELLVNIFDVYIMYTSLDENKGNIRKKEAIEACGVWGIQEKKLFFLGYPDTPNSVENHFFLEKEKHDKVVNDIKEIIDKLRPSYIFGTDFDFHIDHRMASIALEEAIKMVLIDNMDYRPVVLKGFCYETAFYSDEDYKASKVGKSVVKKEHLSNPTLSWAERISINGLTDAGFIWNTKQYKALVKHKSQYAVLHAKSIINVDNVFWIKDTYNLSLYSRIESSSGDSSCLNDFKHIDTDDIYTINPEEIDFSKSVWRPITKDKKPWIEIILPREVTVSEIVLYGHPNAKKNVNVVAKIIIGEKEYTITNIKAFGRGTKIKIQEANVTKIRVEFEMIEQLQDFGLCELEIYEERHVLKKEISTYEAEANDINKFTAFWVDSINDLGYMFYFLMTKIKRKITNMIK